MEALRKLTESRDSGSHQSPSLVKERILELLRVIEQGFKFCASLMILGGLHLKGLLRE